MWAWLKPIKAAVLVVAAVLNQFGSNNPCYESEDGFIGCFSNKSPFDNALGKLPQSPEHINATFRLYTIDTLASNQAPVVIRPNASSLAGSDFQGSRPTKMIIHGFQDTAVGTWVDTLAREILNKDDVNVIAVDWSQGADSIVYEQAVANTRVVGALIAQLTGALVEHKGANVADMHLIGHSLGAHIAGYAGNLTSGELGRITGMDPAGLRFEYRDAAVRLDPTDAQFVDVIHTNGRRFGAWVSMGHVDFFPNGGERQPGCSPTNEDIESIWNVWANLGVIGDAVICSHSRAYRLFTESVSDECQFTAAQCYGRYLNYTLGQCPCGQEHPCVAMGYHTPTDAPHGNYYLTTNRQSPFCMS